MKHKEIRWAAFSDAGGRELNEDRTGVYQNKGEYCFVLCDGLGGHGMGDIASETVTEVFGSLFEKRTENARFLDEAFVAAQDILLTTQVEQRARKMMKTTAVALVIGKEHAWIGHVGDSRAYVFAKNRVLKRTLDHSIPQMLVLTGDIKESQIRFHKERNILLRVMGEKWEDPMQELEKPIPLRKCQAFLLCSDGFWELIEEEEMCRLLKETGSAEEWLREMIKVVQKNGTGKEMDNYSAIAVFLA